MSDITIKEANVAVEVFSKEGTSLGKFEGQQAMTIKIYLENPSAVPFIKVSQAGGKEVYINRDCTCKAESTITLTDKTFDDMSEPMAECHPVRELKLAKDATSIKAGATEQITFTTKPSRLVIGYTSSNPAVATVDANGLITAVSAGEATITAYLKDKTKHMSDSMKVTVTAP